LEYGQVIGVKFTCRFDGEARPTALPAKACGSRLSSEPFTIHPYAAQMLYRNDMCFQPYRVNWFVNVLVTVIQRAVDVSALHPS